MKKALLGALLLLAAGVLWLGSRGGDAGPPEPAAPAVGVAPEPDPSPAQSTPQAERKVLDPAEADHELTATVQGRCVDDTGSPVAGCVVEVRVGGGRRERSHRTTTDVDGTFAFALVPKPSQQLALSLWAPDSVPLHARLGEVEIGTVRDFGDIELQRGSMMSGCVVSSAGTPQSDVEVQVSAKGFSRASRGPFRSSGDHQTRSQADGTFAFTEAVAFGLWDLELQGRHKLSPDSLEIPKGQATTFVEIQTKTVLEIGRILGVLVDEAGAPVEGARVTADSSTPPVDTRSDGTFCLRPAEDSRDYPVLIQFSHPDCEPVRAGKRYSWGTSGLRFVTRRLMGVDVIVTDAETRQPIEDFAVRCDGSLWHPGNYAGGRLTLDLSRGTHAIVVEPQSDEWQSSEPVRFEVTHQGAPRQLVRLSRTVSRTLRVRTASGRPVAGTQVELLRSLDGSEVRVDTRAWEMSHAMHASESSGLVQLMKGKTDSGGEMILAGPASTRLALRLLGPGYAPMVENDVILAKAAGPVTVVVSSGATVRGKIGPSRLLERLRPSGMPAIHVRKPSGERDLLHVFRFRRAGIQQGELSEDGTFEVTGIPPGTWDAHLVYWVQMEQSGSGNRSHMRSTFIRSLPNLQDGEVRELFTNLDHLMPGTVQGRVLLNGRPVVHVRVSLVDARGESMGVVGMDDDGVFTCQVGPGTYSLLVHRQGRGPLPSTDTVTVTADQNVKHVFQLCTGPLRIQVLRADGSPVEGLQVDVRKEGALRFTRTVKTDQQGWATLEYAPVGRLLLTATPKSLTDPKAFREFGLANRDKPGAWDAAQIQLGQVEVRPGGTLTEIEVRMPEGAGY